MTETAMDQETQVIYHLLNQYKASGCENPIFARLVWFLLSPAARENLHALIEEGPLFDGDVPLKSGIHELVEFGLAAKAVVKGEQGYQVATYLGWAVAKGRHLK